MWRSAGSLDEEKGTEDDEGADPAADDDVDDVAAAAPAAAPAAAADDDDDDDVEMSSKKGHAATWTADMTFPGRVGVETVSTPETASPSTLTTLDVVVSIKSSSAGLWAVQPGQSHSSSAERALPAFTHLTWNHPHDECAQCSRDSHWIQTVLAGSGTADPQMQKLATIAARLAGAGAPPRR